MRLLKSVVFASVVAGLLGCGAPANTNIANTNTNIVMANTNQAAATPTTLVDTTASSGSLATPSDAYRTAYAIREKKDVAGMKKIMSKEVIEFLTMMAEGEKKTLDDQIAEMFKRPQAKTAETRNEKITGDRATIEYLDETGNWDVMDFVKEGEEWKLTLPENDSLETASPDKKNP